MSISSSSSPLWTLRITYVVACQVPGEVVDGLGRSRESHGEDSWGTPGLGGESQPCPPSRDVVHRGPWITVAGRRRTTRPDGTGLLGVDNRDVAAALAPGQRAGQVIHEAADLFYHVLVLLAATDVDLAEVEEELAHRFGVSGLDEKASRGRPET